MAPVASPISVLVVEDDPETCRYIASAIESDPTLQLVATAASVRDGVAALTQSVTDVLLVDLGLPDGNGAEIIRFARNVGADTLCLVISVFGDEASVIAAIQAGARGYLLKDDRGADIRRAIEQLVAGGSPLSPAIARHLLRRFAEGEEEKAPDPVTQLPKLSAREREILQCVVKGFTFPEIAELCGISTHTVTTHARRIYRKLEVRSRAEAVFEALSLGIVGSG